MTVPDTIKDWCNIVKKAGIQENEIKNENVIITENNYISDIDIEKTKINLINKHLAEKVTNERYKYQVLFSSLLSNISK